MGCGASKNDVIKSATSSGNEPTVKEAGDANGDTGKAGANGNSRTSSISIASDKNSSSQDSLNSSLKSEGSTIPASEKFGNGSATGNNGNNNDIRTGGLIGSASSNSNRNLPELPPLKPARTSRVGFLEQPTTIDDMAEENKNSMSQFI